MILLNLPSHDEIVVNIKCIAKRVYGKRPLNMFEICHIDIRYELCSTNIALRKKSLESKYYPKPPPKTPFVILNSITLIQYFSSMEARICMFPLVFFGFIAFIRFMAGSEIPLMTFIMILS